MSFLNYIASDFPLPALNPNVRDGMEDDFSIYPAHMLCDIFSEKKYAYIIDCGNFGRREAERLVSYIRENFPKGGELEIWHLWQDDGERPIVRTRQVKLSALCAENIERLTGEDVFKDLYGIPYEYRIVVTE